MHPEVSYDGRRVLFAYSEAESDPSTYGQFPDRYFHLYSVDADGGNLKQLTDGPYDDHSPCLLPSGKIAFCCSFSCFVTSRFDQIKVSVAYNSANVTVVGTHAGCGVGPDGYTQMALEDVAMLRTLPNMAVLQPADDLEASQMVEFLVREHDAPAFLRLTRQAVPRVHDDGYRFEFGKADVMRQGDDLTICATGGVVPDATWEDN